MKQARPGFRVMDLLQEISENFWLSTLVATLISILLGAILAFFWRKILAVLVILRSYVFDVQARLGSEYITKYTGSPQVWLSHEVFDTIRQRVFPYRIEKRAVGEGSMKFYFDRIGHSINVWLEAEPDLSDGDIAKTLDYKVVIELDGELKISFRNLSDFQEFVALALRIEEVVREKCFPGKGPIQRFLVCDVNRKNHLRTKPRKDFLDPNLRVRVTERDDGVNLVCEEPTQAQTALRKYFPL